MPHLFQSAVFRMWSLHLTDTNIVMSHETKNRENSIIKILHITEFVGFNCIGSSKYSKIDFNFCFWKSVNFEDVEHRVCK